MPCLLAFPTPLPLRGIEITQGEKPSYKSKGKELQKKKIFTKEKYE
jgi:hypothetical protein